MPYKKNKYVLYSMSCNHTSKLKIMICESLLNHINLLLASKNTLKELFKKIKIKKKNIKKLVIWGVGHLEQFIQHR